MKTLLGLHKLLAFSPYRPPEPKSSKHTVKLWTKPGGKLVAENISLEQLLREHVAPGRFLCPVDAPKKTHAENVPYLRENNVAQEFNNYYIADFKEQISKPKTTTSKHPSILHLAQLKEIHFNLASPASYTKLSLDRIMSGLRANRPVEVCMRVKGRHIKDKVARYEADTTDVWDFLLSHFPHLHPDFIKAAMPEGTPFLISPWSDGKHLQFVLGFPDQPDRRKKVTTGDKRLLRMKEQVRQSMNDGLQTQLPKAIREKLAAEGNDNYTVDTGLPRSVVQEREDMWSENGWMPIGSTKAHRQLRKKVEREKKQDGWQSRDRISSRPSLAEGEEPRRSRWEGMSDEEREVSMRRRRDTVWQ